MGLHREFACLSPENRRETRTEGICSYRRTMLTAVEVCVCAHSFFVRDQCAFESRMLCLTRKPPRLTIVCCKGLSSPCDRRSISTPTPTRAASDLKPCNDSISRGLLPRAVHTGNTADVVKVTVDVASPPPATTAFGDTTGWI